MKKVSNFEEFPARNPSFVNNKFCDETTKNLMGDFNKFINENQDLAILSEIKLSTVSSISACQLEQISNEIFNKFNYYKQLLNFKEEVNNEFQINCQIFLKQLEKLILKIFNYNDTSLIKNSINRIECLINQNNEKFKDLKGTLSSIDKDGDSFFTQSNEKRLKVKEYVTFLKTLLSLFSFLEENFQFNLEEEKDNLCRLNTFLQILSDFSIKLFEKSSKEYLENFNVERIFQAERENMLKKDNNLSHEEEFDALMKENGIDLSPAANEENDQEKIKEKVKKIYQQNFFQFYFVKEDGIYMKNLASKSESLNSSKKYRYYEIKFKLHNEEESSDINNYVSSILTLFSKYIIAYKERDSDKEEFTKLIISGIAQSQNIMKRELKKIVKQVKKDYLLKITIFNSVKSCLHNIYLKCLDDSNKSYSYFMNL
jgi:hypothetical protein